MNNQLHTIFDPRTACLTQEAMFDYIDGKLSEHDAHLLEKHVLDCAFCSEALEGLELVKDRSKVRAAAILIEGVEEEKKKGGGGRIIPFNFSVKLAAAAVVILLIGSAVLYRITQGNDKQSAEAGKSLHESEHKPEAPLVNTPDDETFSKHFEPYPAETVTTEKGTVSSPDDQRMVSTNSAPTTLSDMEIQQKTGETSKNDNESGATNSFSQSIQPVASPPPAGAASPANIPAQEEQAKPAPAKNVAGKDALKKEEKVAVDKDQRDAGDDVTTARSDDAPADKGKFKTDAPNRSAKKASRNREAPAKTGDNAGPVADEADKAPAANKSQVITSSGGTAGDNKQSDNYKANKTVADSTSTMLGFLDRSSVITAQEKTSLMDSVRTKNTAGLAAHQGYTYSWAPTTVTTNGSNANISQSSGTSFYSTTTPKEKERVLAPGTFTLHVTDANGCATCTPIQLGMEDYKKKEFLNAITEFNKVLATDPKNSTALFYSAVSYLSLSQPDANTAITLLDKVLSDPHSAFADAARWYKSLALIKANRTPEARTLLDEIAKGNSTYKSKAGDVLKEVEGQSKK
jgi:hypothetical protein